MRLPKNNAAVGNFFFGSQIILAVPFFLVQAAKMLQSTQGVVLSFYLCHGVFALLNLWLSISALQGTLGEERRAKRQSVVIYGMWTFVVSAHAMIAAWKMDQLWKPTDTVAALVVITGLALTAFAAFQKGLPLLDPYVKASFAVFFKSVPQVALAYSVYRYGSGGLSGWWIFLGHCTIMLRISHLYLSLAERHDRNTRGSLVSELWNEASWLAATTAWIVF